MLNEYVPINVDIDGQSLKGFFLKINDQFYETYAVILDGCRSFSVWMDTENACWHISKYANLHTDVVQSILRLLPFSPSADS